CSSRRRHTRSKRDWSSDVCSSDLHPDCGPLPTIVVLGGSEGGLSESSAALLASHGFNTFALAYFGIEDLPKELVNIPLDYIEGRSEERRVGKEYSAGRGRIE